MSFDIKPGAETEGLPTIQLAGERRFVPRALLRHTLKMVAIAAKVDAIRDKVVAIKPGSVPDIDDAEFMPWLEMIRQALLPLYPDLTLEDLLDAPIGLDELLAAVPVITAQTSSRRAAAAGEAEAAGSISGASSSPTSTSN